MTKWLHAYEMIAHVIVNLTYLCSIFVFNKKMPINQNTLALVLLAKMISLWSDIDAGRCLYYMYMYHFNGISISLAVVGVSKQIRCFESKTGMFEIYVPQSFLIGRRLIGSV